ncbi:hypothetical protein DTO271D3_6111 [Paecilomyces variotii]|nr:hypothetical protein DTO169E5_585 [Paecilomyces variotii]KAJ9313607.1 hypothetical protein DTO271D3_6111 [Paecilomyces variotii]
MLEKENIDTRIQDVLKDTSRLSAKLEDLNTPNFEIDTLRELGICPVRVGFTEQDTLAFEPCFFLPRLPSTLLSDYPIRENERSNEGVLEEEKKLRGEILSDSGSDCSDWSDIGNCMVAVNYSFMYLRSVSLHLNASRDGIGGFDDDEEDDEEDEEEEDDDEEMEEEQDDDEDEEEDDNEDDDDKIGSFWNIEAMKHGDEGCLFWDFKVKGGGWRVDECRVSDNSPHRILYLVHDHEGNDTSLTRGEVRSVVALFKCRFHLKWYPRYDTMPVLVFSHLGKKGRILQAHHDGQKLILQYSPIVNFEEERYPAIALFIRYLTCNLVGSSVRTLSIR